MIQVSHNKTTVLPTQLYSSNIFTEFLLYAKNDIKKETEIFLPYIHPLALFYYIYPTVLQTDANIIRLVTYIAIFESKSSTELATPRYTSYQKPST